MLETNSETGTQSSSTSKLPIAGHPSCTELMWRTSVPTSDAMRSTRKVRLTTVSARQSPLQDPHDFFADAGGKGWTDRVSKLYLNGIARSDDLEIIGKTKQTLYLWNPETSILPVEWAHVRTGLRLDS